MRSLVWPDVRCLRPTGGILLQHVATLIGRALLCGLALAGAPRLALAQPAQNWPQHTVRMITPLGPGSGMDVAARLFAERLSQKWGQPVVVENRQGADGILAVQSFLSDRDNHSLIFGFAGLHSINPILHGDKLPYDVRDVVPVASAIDSTLALTVSEAAKVNTLAEFVALAKAQPGKLNWAATTGLPLYVVAALQKVAGIDITQISYRDFSPAFQDFASGRVQLLATGITLLLPQVQAGRGKFLMVTNTARSPLAPEVPTPQEAGFPRARLQRRQRHLRLARHAGKSQGPHRRRRPRDRHRSGGGGAAATHRRDHAAGQRRRVRRRGRRTPRLEVPPAPAPRLTPAGSSPP